MRSSQSERLQALRDDAREVREKLSAKEITAEEAARRLDGLRSRHTTFLGRLFFGFP
jgi:hypothetical protein